MNFAVYARTAVSQESGLNIPLIKQVNECQEHGLSKGFELVEPIYEEVAQGLTLENRPMLDEVLTSAKEGKFQILIIQRYDRLSRSPRHLTSVLDQLHEFGIQVMSVTENEDIILLRAALQGES